MLIDWFTVSAQMINFVILIWLLKRFLYKPILDTIDQRNKGIADQLAAAESKENDAKKSLDDYNHKNADFDTQRMSLLAKATDDANGERQKLIDQAHKDADDLRAKQSDALDVQRQGAVQNIVQHNAVEVFSIARKMLTDLASTSLEEHMTDVFVTRIRSLDDKEKGLMGESLKANPQTASVQSAYNLPQAQQDAITNACHEVFLDSLQINFQVKPQLVSGIELSTSGYKIGWSITDYLDQLETSANLVLKDPHAV